MSREGAPDQFVYGRGEHRQRWAKIAGDECSVQESEVLVSQRPFQAESLCQRSAHRLDLFGVHIGALAHDPAEHRLDRVRRHESWHKEDNGDADPYHQDIGDDPREHELGELHALGSRNVDWARLQTPPPGPLPNALERGSQRLRGPPNPAGGPTGL